MVIDRTEEYMRTTPREQWPKVLLAAAARAERLGLTVRQVFDEDLKLLRASMTEPLTPEEEQLCGLE
jgi:hypothetical protein